MLKPISAAIILILISSSVMSEGKMIPGVGDVVDKRFTTVRDPYTRCDVSGIMSFRQLSNWERRKAVLKEQILASAGLLPMPKKTPLKAVVSGKIDCGDYTVEKVRFESFPGFFVNGNLYTPKGKGPFPAVLNPHGHWAHGRLENSDDCSIPGRCINFAKQGYIAFAYDMVGYCDSKHQMPHDIAGQKERLWGISLGGLQLWNSIRTIDFIETLPNVDTSRIACTGASGGGTQTFLLAAVDERVKVCAPVNMISAHMQGGCQCENTPNLRLDTNNVEIAAMIAPRPMLMVSATGDWTDETPLVEYPAIQHIYSLYGASDKVSCVQFKANHNYNKDSREAVYSWFGQWLPEKPLAGPVKEQSFEVEKDADLLVYADGKLPSNAVDREHLVKELIESSERQLETHKPGNPVELRSFIKQYLIPYMRALAVTKPVGVNAELRGKMTIGDTDVQALVIKDSKCGAEIPALMFRPAAKKPENVILVVHEKGKSALLEGSNPGPFIGQLIDKGCGVLAIDCFGIGEHAVPKDAPERAQDGVYFATYNRTDTSERIYDIVTAINYIYKTSPGAAIHVTGLGKAGLWCLLAVPLMQGISSFCIDAAGFDTSSDDAFIADTYIPCLRRAGDFRSAQTLLAPVRLFIHNTNGRFDTSWGEAAYRAAEKPDAFRSTKQQASEEEIVKELLVQ